MTDVVELALTRSMLSIKQIDSRIELLKSDIFREEVGRIALESAIASLEHALSNQKKDGTIPLLKEYKKMQQELVILNNRWILSTGITKHTNFQLEQAIKDREDALYLIQVLKEKMNSRRVIVPFKKL